MRVTVYVEVMFRDGINQEIPIRGFSTHVITLSNEEAVTKLVEHFQSEALDTAGLEQSDFLEYDPILD